MSGAPERRIVGFRQDDDGWWVADLECGHGQHMRHDPPWHVRAWVTTAQGRAGMLGRSVACGKCPPNAVPSAGADTRPDVESDPDSADFGPSGGASRARG